MIARIWHGTTSLENFQPYTEFLRRVAIPDYKKTRGFKGLTFLRRVEDTEAHFTLVTYWTDIEAIKEFAGPEFRRAKYYPEDEDYLLEFEEYVEHHEVFSLDLTTMHGD